MQAGWLVQARDDMNLTAGDGIAVSEFKLERRRRWEEAEFAKLKAAGRTPDALPKDDPARDPGREVI